MSLTAIGISFEVAKLVEFREGGGGGERGGKLKSILGEGREKGRQRERERGSECTLHSVPAAQIVNILTETCHK